jgi:hypothetical protein
MPKIYLILPNFCLIVPKSNFIFGRLCTAYRALSVHVLGSRTGESAPLQFKILFTTYPVTVRAQVSLQPVAGHKVTNQSMPLEDLEQYGSDSGSSNDSRDLDTMPNSRKQYSDPISGFFRELDCMAAQNSTGNLIQMIRLCTRLQSDSEDSDFAHADNM